MSKRKCDSAPQEEANSSTCGNEFKPERKRQRPSALNFSIESIMSSSSADEQQQLHSQQLQRRQQSSSPDDISSGGSPVGGVGAAAAQPPPQLMPPIHQIASSNRGALFAASAAFGNRMGAAQAPHSPPTMSLGASAANHDNNRASSTGTSANCSASGSAGAADSRLSQVECQLDNKDMWDKFHSLNTEMIITKTGRRMFPVMKVQFHNLDPKARYAVSMDIVPVDNKRYRYAYHKSCWQVAGKADPSAEPRLYPHPDSPFNGDLLSRQVISFEKVKLTNNEMDKSGHIILNSMHKYQPRVHLIELKSPPTANSNTNSNTNNNTNTNHNHQHNQQQTTSKLSTSSNYHHHNHHHHNHVHNHNLINSSNSSSSSSNSSSNSNHSQQNNSNSNSNNNNNQQAPQLIIEAYRTFVFPETVFTAVTAYQNQLITKMKIDKNPFAKGFRDSSRLSDLDRNDPFDYMGSLGPSGRFVGQPGGPVGSLEAVGAHMDAYQLLASAASNPWYSAASVAAAAHGGANPFNPMAAQLQAQMWLTALSACLNGGGPPGSGGGAPPGSGAGAQGTPPMSPASP